MSEAAEFQAEVRRRRERQQRINARRRVAMKTSREVAEQIVNDLNHGPNGVVFHATAYEPHGNIARSLVNSIEAALNAERERCAKIADKMADTLRKAAHVVQQPTAEALRMAELAIVSADDIAREIRGRQA